MTTPFDSPAVGAPYHLQPRNSELEDMHLRLMNKAASLHRDSETLKAMYERATRKR